MNYYIRELNVGEVFDQTITLVRNHFKKFITILLILLAPIVVAMVALGVFFSMPSVMNTTEIRPEYVILAVVLLILVFAYILSYTMAEAAIVYAMANEYLGKPSTPRQSIRYAFSKIVPIIVTGILVYLLVVAGTLLCIIPGIIALLFTCFTTNVVVIEGIGYGAAISRSAQLFKTSPWEIILFGLVVFAIAIGTSVLSALMIIPWLQELVSYSLDIVLMAVIATGKTVLYFSCRSKLEGFDLEMMADALAQDDFDLNP